MIYAGRVLSSDQLSKMQVMELWSQLFLFERDRGLREVENPEMILRVIVSQLTEIGVVLLAKEGDAPVGFLAATPGAYVGTPACGLMVLGCFVEFGHQNTGVLGSLFFALRGYCRDRGIESVQFAVAEGNEMMGPVAERHGRIVGKVYEKQMLREVPRDQSLR